MPNTDQLTSPPASTGKRTSPPKPNKVFGPRCLAPLLDVEAGQTVLFIGHDQTLTRLVKQRGAVPLSVVTSKPKAGKSTEGRIHLESPEAPLPLEDASVDHIVAASANKARWTPERLAELARVAAPGATLLFGAASRARFPLRGSAQTPRGGRRLLASAGFTGTRLYGVRHDFRDPRFLVPLDRPGARTWFFSSIYPPQTPRHTRVAALLARLPRTWLDHVYFPNVLFVATRERGL